MYTLGCLMLGAAIMAGVLGAGWLAAQEDGGEAAAGHPKAGEDDLAGYYEDADSWPGEFYGLECEGDFC